MPITSDWHIHTHNSCDEAALTLADLLSGAAANGITDFGITDHLHTPVNLPDLLASRAEFDAAAPSLNVHFGVELSSVSQWELDAIATGRHGQPTYGLRDGGPAGGALALGITARELAALGVEYVVAGTHWPMYVPFAREAIIRDYHRQNMHLATHPLVTIVAHPWWWMGHWQAADGSYPAEPWFDDFRAIPASLHDEFAAAAREHGKVVEINIGAQLLHPGYPASYKAQYLDYLAMLNSRGVSLSIGSDCHDAQYDIDFAAAEALLASVGIHDEDLWRLPPRG